MADKKTKSLPQPVSSKPLFDWFGDRANRAKLRAAGFSDGQITNWKERGIPRAQLDRIAPLMGMTTEQYLVAAGETPATVARQSVATYSTLSDEALAIARAFDELQPQAREFIREQVFIYTVIDKSFPWLRRGRPVGASYGDFEKWHQQNIALAIKGGVATETTKK